MKVKIAHRGVEASVSAGSSNGGVKQQICAKLVRELGGTYASTLGINLASMESEEIFKWFLATVLFGARIGEAIAIKTYREFEKVGVLSPDAVLKTGWQSRPHSLRMRKVPCRAPHDLRRWLLRQPFGRVLHP